MQSKWLWMMAFVAVLVAGVARVAITRGTFSEVLDEPAHIACGYDWLTGRDYANDPTHPPLERVLSAIPAVIDHVEVPDNPDFIARGNAILYWGDRYRSNLARARTANLFFLLVGMLATAWWTARLFGRGTALLATAIYASLPPILGHAGVATTDVAAAATIPLALVSLEWWLDSPTPRRGLLFGTAIGAGLLSKFSFLVFFGVGGVVIVLSRLARASTPAARASNSDSPALAKSAAIALLTAFVLVWAGYRFETGTLDRSHTAASYVVENGAPAPLKPLAVWIGRNIPLPAPLFFVGAGMVKLHDRDGHRAYLLGEIRQRGWWYYFPVLLFYKTPLPFLALALAGIGIIGWRERRALQVALVPLAMIAAVLGSSINIGIRHVLPVYAPLSAVAAYAVVWSWRNAWGRAASAALVAWLFAGVALAHPDYLAWFNEAAGRHPERIAVDSNLDWGQDVLRLAQVVREKKIDRLKILYTGNALLERHGIAADAAQPWMPAPGWWALSLTELEMNADARRGGYRWLDDYRYTMVGKSIRLYDVK